MFCVSEKRVMVVRKLVFGYIVGMKRKYFSWLVIDISEMIKVVFCFLKIMGMVDMGDSRKLKNSMGFMVVVILLVKNYFFLNI